MTEITDTPSNRSIGQPLARWGPVVAMMAAIFYFSAQPFDGPELAWWEVVARKLGHVTGYALLTVAWWWALRGLVARPILWAAGLSFLYGCSDEYHQTFVDGRTGKVLDVGIDSIGIALACLALSRRGGRRPAAEGV